MGIILLIIVLRTSCLIKYSDHTYNKFNNTTKIPRLLGSNSYLTHHFSYFLCKSEK